MRQKVWIAAIQQIAFPDEIATLGKGGELSKGCLLPFHPFMDEEGLLRVGGRIHQSMESYDKRHSFIMPSKQRVTRMLIKYEHTHLLRSGPTLAEASLARRFAIVGARRTMREVTHRCAVCRRIAGTPCPQLPSQLPANR